MSKKIVPISFWDDYFFVKWNIFLAFSTCAFSEFTSCPSWHRCIYHFWTSGRGLDISISIGICPKSGFSAYFSSSEESDIIVAFRIFDYSYNTQIFRFFSSKLSFWIFESFGSSQSCGLFLLLGFLFCNTLLICSWCHNASQMND